MADAQTETIRQAIRDGLRGTEFEHVRVAQDAEFLQDYPHIRVQHGGWFLDDVGYVRRWNVWFRYAFPGDPTDGAYGLEQLVITILHNGGLALPNGNGDEMRLFRGDRERYLATRLRFRALGVERASEMC